MSVSIIALLHGPDQPGIVAKVAGWIHQRGGNVLHADQHLDLDVVQAQVPADERGRAYA